jgi:hypothetical protein
VNSCSVARHRQPRRPFAWHCNQGALRSTLGPAVDALNVASGAWISSPQQRQRDRSRALLRKGRIPLLGHAAQAPITNGSRRRWHCQAAARMACRSHGTRRMCPHPNPAWSLPRGAAAPTRSKTGYLPDHGPGLPRQSCAVAGRAHQRYISTAPPSSLSCCNRLLREQRRPRRDPCPCP